MHTIFLIEGKEIAVEGCSQQVFTQTLRANRGKAVILVGFDIPQTDRKNTKLTGQINRHEISLRTKNKYSREQVNRN